MTEVVTTRPPFETRIEDFRNGATTYTDVSSFGRDKILDNSASIPLIFALPPAPTGLRPDVTAAGLGARAVVVGRRRILGRDCDVFRTAGPATAGSLPVSDPNRDEVCLDADGLLLAEQIGGRVATRVEINPQLAPDTFDTAGAAVPVTEGGGSIRPVDPRSRPPGPFWELGPIPAGFSLMGRYAVIPPSNLPDRRAGVDDVLRRGVDTIIVERGGTLHGSPPFPTEAAAGSIDLGPLGSGVTLLGLGVEEVRAVMPDGHYVLVFGTADIDVLAKIARELHQVTGGQLAYLPSS